MAYDVDLAERLRALLGGERDVSEKHMFGGLAFMVGGHLAVSASGRGGLLLRVDPAEAATLLTDPSASRFVMRGREMNGWLHIDVDGAVEDAELMRWVDIGTGYTRSLSVPGPARTGTA